MPSRKPNLQFWLEIILTNYFHSYKLFLQIILILTNYSNNYSLARNCSYKWTTEGRIEGPRWIFCEKKSLGRKKMKIEKHNSKLIIAKLNFYKLENGNASLWLT